MRQTWHQEHKNALTSGDRFAEWVTGRVGSMSSIAAHTALFIACFLLVLFGYMRLQAMLLWLTTIVSLEAIYIGLFLQNSSNRHGDAMEKNAIDDLTTTIASKQELEELQDAIGKLELDKIDVLLSKADHITSKLDRLIKLVSKP